MDYVANSFMHRDNKIWLVQDTVDVPLPDTTETAI